MDWIAVAAGAAAGVLSGLGVGGGTLLLVYMTTWAGVAQQAAQGVNLLFFLPAAAMSLPAHVQNRYVHWQTLLPAALAGMAATALAAWAATGLDTQLLHRLFGLFLLGAGVYELLVKD